jgi:hypothetical protein
MLSNRNRRFPQLLAGTLTVLCACPTASTAHADFITYAYTGEITSADPSGRLRH